MQTIAPAVPLTKELESLHDFLLHQSAHHSANAQREVHGTRNMIMRSCVGLKQRLLVLELAQLSDKELEAKVRELVNWDFRLNLDEGLPLNLLATLICKATDSSIVSHAQRQSPALDESPQHPLQLSHGLFPASSVRS